MVRTITGIISFLLLLFSVNIYAQDCNLCHQEVIWSLPGKPASMEEKGVGILDKGQLRTYTSNFGDIANWHTWQNDAMRWPGNAGDEVQYCFGLGLVVATPGNVIESISGAFSGKVDWTPVDNSMGRVFSGDVVAVTDQTPFLPFSDNRLTWPEGYYEDSGIWISTPGERHWPGWFRIDPNPLSLSYGKEITGEFASDRDIYAVYDDSRNPLGSLGLVVEQMSYSYGRPYAEDLVFFEFYITNTGSVGLDSVYAGFYAAFRPDYDYHDFIQFVDTSPTDNNVNGDLIYIYDVNNQKDGAWEDENVPMGIIGLLILDTPGDLGVTDFHYFSRNVNPDSDEKMWAIISSKRDSPFIESSFYFHGENRRIDTTDLDSLQVYFPPDSGDLNWPGAPINFYVMSGPISLPADSSLHLSMAVVMGNAGDEPFNPDTTDLMQNARMARRMWQNWFQGSGPPAPPRVEAFPDNHKVTLYWSAEPSESSHDILTGERDFEGYKIYRSTDRGKTWGDPITDAEGNLVGYKPLAIFDLVDGIEGPDPAFPQILGYDTGLKHTFVDSNLINGVEYWYSVCPYDRGNQNPDSLEQSYQYPPGSSPMEPHTVAVIPGVRAVDYGTLQAPLLTPDNGIPCDGKAELVILNPDSLTGHTYRLTFADSLIGSGVEETTKYYKGFTLVDMTIGDTLLKDYPLSDASGDNLPVVDGFRLVLIDPEEEVTTYWSTVRGDTSTFIWTVDPWGPYDPKVVETDYSFRVVIDTLDGIHVRWFDLWSEKLADSTVAGGIYQDTLAYLPIRVYVLTEEGETEVGVTVYLGEYLSSPFGLFTPLGWDLTPGGAAYAPAYPYPDKLIFQYITEENDTNIVWLNTQHEPDARAPSQGDEFVIKRYLPFRKEVSYTFTTPLLTRSSGKSDKGLLKDVRVVPDPYIVANAYEVNEYGKRLKFNNLPSECTITIYNLAGEYIASFKHSGAEGYEFWDMRTYNDQYIAPGVYLYVVKTPSGEKKVGRFLVIK